MLCRTYEKIKEYRNQLHLSKEYVATYLGIDIETFAKMEAGEVKASAEELTKLSTLFGISSNMLLRGSETLPITLSDCSEKLDESDKTEIVGLIRFKEMIKTQRSAG